MEESTRACVGLEELFALLHRALTEGIAPAALFRRTTSARRTAAEGDLFASAVEGGEAEPPKSADGSAAVSAAEAERTLARYSPWARLDFIYAWMSELPIESEMLDFAAQVVAAGRAAERSGAGFEAVRAAAEAARTDRGDPAVRATLAAVQKVTREEHRLIGLLRFSECADGRLVARCGCDHAVLPALAEHFSARFGLRRWAIVDERRGTALVCDPPEPPRLVPEPEADLGFDSAASARGDEWEDLWKGYHRAIAIDSRKNPGLQRRLMPARYWKYLTELR